MSLFGDVARRLEPRALLTPELQTGRAPSGTILLGCAAGDLRPAEERVLESIGDVERASSRVAAGRIQIRGTLARLESAAREERLAALLLHSLRNAHRRWAPPRMLGILNVTPDSFSDGGAFLAPERAIEQGLKLVRDGAEMLDVGGESTRPGSVPVPQETERERILPVIEGLRRKTNVPISIDTTKASVARAALDSGATIVNDVSAGRFDDEMLPSVAERGAGIVLMHMQNSPRDMQTAPHYEDVVTEVTAHLRGRVHACLNAGIPLHKIAVDPGIGFGKRLKDNLELVRSIPELRSLGLPIVLGVSRKSFLGAITGHTEATERETETLAALACTGAADIHRVHDVGGARRALEVAAAIRGESAEAGA